MWCELLKTKYLRGTSLYNWHNNKRASHLWRGIMKTCSILRKGVKWTVGNGNNVNVWKDWWCGDKAFIDLESNTNQNLHNNCNVDNVSELLNSDGSWNEIKVHSLCTPNIASLILNNPPPDTLEMDSPLWKRSPAGSFNVSSVYNLILGETENEEDWNWLWRMRIPQNLEGFLWTVFHGKLLTNQMRLKRGLTDDPKCPNCCGVEDLSHLFRDCFKAKEVWLAICNQNWYRDMMKMPWLEWLESNAKNKKLFNDTISWQSVFTISLWKFWKNRNLMVFEQKSTPSQESFKFILDYSREIHQAFLHSISKTRPAFRIINWCLPPAGRLKLNTDGSRRVGGDGGFGGLIRDERGTWVCGYYGKLHSGTSLEAELWAVYKGLTIILQKGMNQVMIETNAEQVVQLLQEEPGDRCPFKNLVEDAQILLRGCDCSVQHVWKEGNLCADFLAKMGANQPEEILVMNDPPAELRELLVADMIGLGRMRT